MSSSFSYEAGRESAERRARADGAEGSRCSYTRGSRLDGAPGGEDDIDAMGNNVGETCRVPVQSVYDMRYERFPTGHRRQHRKMNENLANKDTCNVNSLECPQEQMKKVSWSGLGLVSPGQRASCGEARLQVGARGDWPSTS